MNRDDSRKNNSKIVFLFFCFSVVFLSGCYQGKIHMTEQDVVQCLQEKTFKECIGSCSALTIPSGYAINMCYKWTIDKEIQSLSEKGCPGSDDASCLDVSEFRNLVNASCDALADMPSGMSGYYPKEECLASAYRYGNYNSTTEGVYCFDSDNGRNDKVYGHVIYATVSSGPFDVADSCGTKNIFNDKDEIVGSESYLIENYCEGNTKNFSEIVCNNGCVDGVCE